MSVLRSVKYLRYNVPIYAHVLLYLSLQLSRLRRRDGAFEGVSREEARDPRRSYIETRSNCPSSPSEEPLL
jgi:hypothetical protein